MRFTVLTPTYNRAHLLGRVFASLSDQTFRDFEWVIVDDGSTDNTAELVASWKADFPIRYSAQKNGGKHTAVNAGVRLARGELILIADSDDRLLPCALERFDDHWKRIPDPSRYAFVVASCYSEDGRVLGHPVPGDQFDAFGVAQALPFFDCDRSSTCRADVFRQFLYPVFPEETFMLEGLVWYRILEKYGARYINEPLKIAGYAPGGLRAQGDLRPKSPRGALLFYWELATKYPGIPLLIRFNSVLNAGRFFPRAMMKSVLSKAAGVFGAARAHSRPARFILARVLRRLRISPLFLIQDQDVKMRFFPTSHSASLWADPSYWSQDSTFLRRYLRLGDAVIDVGANVGYLSLVSSRVVGQAGRVIAIEPHPKIFRFLCANIALGQANNISPVNCAIGDRSGRALISDVRPDDQNAIASSNGLSIRMERLDSLTADLNEIALLKIDVEGYEKFVLAGAHSTLSKTQCVYFESWDTTFAKYGYLPSEVGNILKSHGFTILRRSGDNLVIPIDEPHTSPQCENLLAVRHIDEFCARTDFHLPTVIQLN